MAEKQLIIKIKGRDQLSGPVRGSIKMVLKLASSVLRATKRIGTGLKSVIRRLTSLKALVIGTLAVLTVRRVFTSLTRARDEIDLIAKTAKRLGVSVEELSALKFAAGQTGAEFAELTTAVRRGLTNMVDFVAKGTGPTADALARIGLGIEDITDKNGKIKKVTDLFITVGDALAKVDDQATRVNLANVVFGRGGVQVLTLLQQGGDELRSLLNEAQQLGIVTGRQAALSEAWVDSLGRVSQAWLSLRGVILEHVAPPIIQFLDGLAVRLGEIRDLTGNLASSLAGSIGRAIAGSTPEVRLAGIDDIRFIAEQVLAVLKAGAKGLGLTIGTAFIETAKVGFSIIFPLLTNAIRDAIPGIPGSPTERFQKATEGLQRTRSELQSIQTELRKQTDDRLVAAWKLRLRDQMDLVMIFARRRAKAQQDLAKQAEQTRAAFLAIGDSATQIADQATRSVREFNGEWDELQRRVDNIVARDRGIRLLGEHIRDFLERFRGQTKQATLDTERMLGLLADPEPWTRGLRAVQQIAGVVGTQMAQEADRVKAKFDKIKTDLSIRALAVEGGDQARIGQLIIKQQRERVQLAQELGPAYGAIRDQLERIQILELKRARGPVGLIAGLKEGVSGVTGQLDTMGKVGTRVGETLASGLGSGIGDALESIVTGAKSAAEAFKDMARSILSQISKLIIQFLVLRALSSLFPGGADKHEGGAVRANIGGLISSRGLRQFAVGGVVATMPTLALAPGGAVPGPNINRDIVPAMLTPGEFVLKRSAVQQIGVAALNRMNRGDAGGGVNVNLNVNVSGGMNQSQAHATGQTVGRIAVQALITELGRNPALRDAMRRELG